MAAEDTSEQLQKNIEALIDIIGSLVETRDMEGIGHMHRMRAFTGVLATEVMNEFPEYELNRHRVKVISEASTLHDVGKITIPENILFKPGRLTKEEFEMMKTHTVLGCGLLNKMKDAWNEEFHEVCVDICRHHHEKFDGNGYPDGLAGDDISIAAQITALVDIYDALVCEKPYKPAFSPEQAFKMIIDGECGIFNPKIITAFKNCSDTFTLIVNKSRELERAKK